jgi:hypothetical protein
VLITDRSREYLIKFESEEEVRRKRKRCKKRNDEKRNGAKRKILGNMQT